MTNNYSSDAEHFLSAACISFLSRLNHVFSDRIKQLLDARTLRNKSQFDIATSQIRNTYWKCEPVPEEISVRHVEITGPPVPAKMIVNAVTSGANCYMADFEDSLSPTWNNIITGQQNLHNYLTGDLQNELPDKYREKLASCNKRSTLMVRPRGLHMVESHMLNMSASLFDFGVYLFNNHEVLKSLGSRPYFYLAKLEHGNEAIWWADVFKFSENYLGLSENTIKCTVLIETAPAAFQMNEIVHALKNSITGLNAGRWDYLFSFIKNNPCLVLPHRDSVGMDETFLKAYSEIIVSVCNTRGITPMGGMSAFIPTKDDQSVIDKIITDKTLEAKQGFEGAWAAHPGYVETIRKVFQENSRELNDTVSSSLLSDTPQVGSISKDDVAKNATVCVKYIAAWLKGNGCVAIDGKMEDAATAEICRMQVWQWLQHNKISQSEVSSITYGAWSTEEKKDLDLALGLFFDLVFSDQPNEFLTTSAYKELMEHE